MSSTSFLFSSDTPSEFSIVHLQQARHNQNEEDNQNRRSDSVKLERIEHPRNAGFIIFDDGQAKLNRQLLLPDRPVVVQVEGLEPTEEQIEMCRHLWVRLYEAMDFPSASFCPVLLPHQRRIMTPIETIPAA
ncbi:hypothetical protein ACQR1H_31265 [Bradyrhizobium sp. HKCCYLRH2015]|uniref:hypothetical protein n=1 Tax=Bradyrhizobium TaxID=374 RepID=UPI003EBD8184